MKIDEAQVRRVVGFDISIMSMCGLVALAGVVVNDSLVMVDFVNRHRFESSSLLEAIENAGARRFRAITLTSLTTFVGLVPMLLETDMQAKFLIPMAVSLAFGILFATLITLFLVPSIYMILDDVQRIADAPDVEVVVVGVVGVGLGIQPVDVVGPVVVDVAARNRLPVDLRVGPERPISWPIGVKPNHRHISALNLLRPVPPINSGVGT